MAIVAVALVVAALLAAPSHSVDVVGGELFRVHVDDVGFARDNRATYRVVLSEFPDRPSWLQDPERNVFFGQTPALTHTRTKDFPLVVVRLHPEESVQLRPVNLRLKPSEPDYSQDLWAARFRIRSHNLTQAVDDRWQSLLNVLASYSVPQTNAPPVTVAMSLVNISHGEPTPRNVPANFFDPPVPPPNFWMNRSAFVYVTAQTSQVPTCAELELTNSQWTNEGLVVDWTACRVQVLRHAFTAEPSVAARVRTEDGDNVVWTRSTKDFDRSVVPALVIACFLLLIAFLYVLSRLCCRMRPWHRQQMQETMVMNQLKRAAMQSRRGAAPISSGPSPPQYQARGGDPQLLSHRRLPEDTADRQWPDAMVAVQQARADTRAPPPSYRRPPDHVFNEHM